MLNLITTLGTPECKLADDLRRYEDARQGRKTYSTRAATITVPVADGAIEVTLSLYGSLDLSTGDITWSVSLPTRKIAGAVAITQALSDAIRDTAVEAVSAWPSLAHAQTRAVATLTSPTTTTERKGGAGKLGVTKVAPALMAALTAPAVKLATLTADGQPIATAAVASTPVQAAQKPAEAASGKGKA
jgi:hypothetical protein